MRFETLRVDDLSRDAALAELSSFLEQNVPGAVGGGKGQVGLSIGTAYQLELVRCGMEGRAPPPPPELLPEEASNEATTVMDAEVAESQQAAMEMIMMDTDADTAIKATERKKSSKKQKKKQKSDE
jgi:hypothetical protein